MLSFFIPNYYYFYKYKIGIRTPTKRVESIYRMYTNEDKNEKSNRIKNWSRIKISPGAQEPTKKWEEKKIIPWPLSHLKTLHEIKKNRTLIYAPKMQHWKHRLVDRLCRRLRAFKTPIISLYPQWPKTHQWTNLRNPLGDIDRSTKVRKMHPKL